MIATNQIQMRESMLINLGLTNSDLTIAELMQLCYIKNSSK